MFSAFHWFMLHEDLFHRIFYAPFENEGAYSFANVSRLVGWSVSRLVDFISGQYLENP